VANKIAKLKQDIVEVKGKFEDITENTEHNFNTVWNLLNILKESIEILDEDLKEHLETVENFISDVRWFMNSERFFELLKIINNAIEELKGLKIVVKDFENKDFRMKSVEYDSHEDEVYFYCEEDK